MTPLEERYRRLLRWLPDSYRARWEEEMVGTFLESMLPEDLEEAEHVTYCARPSRSERWSVAGLAVRLRLGGVDAPARSFAWGEAARVVALIGLLVGAAGSTVAVLVELWVAGVIGLPVPADALGSSLPSSALDILWNLTWPAAFFALLLGQRAAAQGLAAVAVMPLLWLAVTSTGSAAIGRPPMIAHISQLWAELLLTGTVVLALAAFHRAAPPVRARPWMVAYLVAVLVMAGVSAVWIMSPDVTRTLVDLPALWSAGILLASIIHLNRRPGENTPPTVGRTLGLAVLAAGVLVIRISSTSGPPTARWGSRGRAPCSSGRSRTCRR
jgi:hypothetical protein